MKNEDIAAEFESIEPGQRKYARCAKCRTWRWRDALARLQCPACEYQTFRCNDCGGADGALRSIRSHFVWWTTRGHQDGGHRKAIARMVREITRRWFGR